MVAHDSTQRESTPLAPSARPAWKRACRRFAVIALRFIGGLPVIFAFGIITGIFCVAVAVIIPAIHQNIVLRIILWALANACVSWILRSLYYVLTAPFTSAEDCIEMEGGNGPENSIYCERCRINTPRHAHHCAVCAMCVMHHDHHCVFMNRCIGAGNIEHFHMFLNSCIVSTAAMLLFGSPIIINWSKHTSGLSWFAKLFALGALGMSGVVLMLVGMMKFMMVNDSLV